MHCKTNLGSKPPYKGEDFDGTPFKDVETHGLCDDCLKKYYPEVLIKTEIKEERKK